MLRYLYRDVLNGFIFILILFSLGEIITLISLNVAGMPVDPKGGYAFLQQMETSFASFSFNILHSIPRFLNLTSFRDLLAYFTAQLLALIILLRQLDSDQKEIARLKSQIAELTMTPSEKRRLNATFGKKAKNRLIKVRKSLSRWWERRGRGVAKGKPRKKEKKPLSSPKGKT